MQAIKVSVIMPVYNAEDYLRQCLDSVMNQTLKEIEIICVDDGSTDSSPVILEEYAGRDGRLQVLHQENKYAGCARNLGLSKASGKYVIFWDSDDFFALETLEKLYAKCEEDQAQIGICGANKLDNELQLSYPAGEYLVKSRVPETMPFNKRQMGRYLFNFCSNVPWNKLFLRSFILEHHLEFQPLRQANDVYFSMMALFLAERMTVVPENLVTYRFFNSSSLTGKVSETRYCTVEAYRAVLRQLEQYPEFTPEIRQSFSNKTIGPLLSTMRLQVGLEAYEEMFAYYRDTVFPEFELSNREKEFFNSQQDYEDIKRIQECSYTEFLLYLAQSYERRFKMEKGQRIAARQDFNAKKKEFDVVRKELAEVNKECRRLRQVEASTAYKVGRAVTWLPRTVKDVVKPSGKSLGNADDSVSKS